MAIVEVTITPLGTQTPSVSYYVAEVHKVLEQSGLTHQLTPMSTIIEGDLQEIIAVIQKMHEVPFEKGALRVSTSIRIDDRRDIEASMEQKLKSVQDKI